MESGNKWFGVEVQGLERRNGMDDADDWVCSFNQPIRSAYNHADIKDDTFFNLFTWSVPGVVPVNELLP